MIRCPLCGEEIYYTDDDIKEDEKGRFIVCPACKDFFRIQ